MNNKVIAKIVSIANELDLSGNHNEADALTKVAKRLTRTTVAFYPEHEPEPAEEVCPECDNDMEWSDDEGAFVCGECGHVLDDSEESAEDYYGYDPDQDDDIY